MHCSPISHLAFLRLLSTHCCPLTAVVSLLSTGSWSNHMIAFHSGVSSWASRGILTFHVAHNINQLSFCLLETYLQGYKIKCFQKCSEVITEWECTVRTLLMFSKWLNGAFVYVSTWPLALALPGCNSRGALLKHWSGVLYKYVPSFLYSLCPHLIPKITAVNVCPSNICLIAVCVLLNTHTVMMEQFTSIVFVLLDC